MVPPSRISDCNTATVRADGDYVLYWMVAFRRTQWNFSLDRAVEWAQQLGKPLVVFEPLRIGYRWASERFHRFVLDGMADNASRLEQLANPGLLYYPYVEPAQDADKGLLESLAQRACVVVTDDYPAFFLPRMLQSVAFQLPVRCEKVDSNGMFPIRSTENIFPTAFAFRAYLQRELRPHLDAFPQQNPLHGVDLPAIDALPDNITRRWPAASPTLLGAASGGLAALDIDHTVSVVETQGGTTAARQRLQRFLNERIADYATGANEPDTDTRSGLSSYLHFGHISAHELFHAVAASQDWTPAKLAPKGAGKREGWWGMSPGAEAWLDELITWRELGYNMAAHATDYDQFESLPEWAKKTLGKHARDPREHIYSLSEFAAAETHDPIWNAAQRQLLREGRIHNYLRMLWGKKILEWSATPQDALDVMIELNNRYALDGRDPNSYSGIFWCLGRYDRPWGPERPIFGTVRYMSSENTRKKLRLTSYLAQFAAEEQQHFL